LLIPFWITILISIFKFNFQHIVSPLFLLLKFCFRTESPSIPNGHSRYEVRNVNHSCCRKGLRENYTHKPAAPVTYYSVEQCAIKLKNRESGWEKEVATYKIDSTLSYPGVATHDQYLTRQMRRKTNEGLRCSQTKLICLARQKGEGSGGEKRRKTHNGMFRPFANFIDTQPQCGGKSSYKGSATMNRVCECSQLFCPNLTP
jgi:hypothetical protein